MSPLPAGRAIPGASRLPSWGRSQPKSLQRGRRASDHVVGGVGPASSVLDQPICRLSPRSLRRGTLGSGGVR